MRGEKPIKIRVFCEIKSVLNLNCHVIQNKSFEENNCKKGNGFKLFIIKKNQKHFAKVKNIQFLELVSLGVN